MPWWAYPIMVPLIPVVLAMALVVFILWSGVATAVLVTIWLTWLPRGKRVLLVHSESTVWKEDIEVSVIPVLGSRVVLLNWSDRNRWSNFSLAPWVFRLFNRSVNYCPMAFIFRPFLPLKTVRMYYAYKEAKAGMPSHLEMLKKELFELAGVANG
jgi:hypothetical protein